MSATNYDTTARAIVTPGGAPLGESLLVPGRLFADWLNTARGTTDTAQRQGIYTRFQTYVVDTQAYTVPLYVPRNSVAYGSTVHGVLTDPGSGTTFSAYNVWLEQ